MRPGSSSFFLVVARICLEDPFQAQAMDKAALGDAVA
jgi:hypothetical protein